MNFQETKNYLYNLKIRSQKKGLGLENSRALFKELGVPHSNCFKIQIAGTNGKGSTGSFLSSILTTAHINNGLNTSPHLISLTERVRINDKEVSKEIFAKHASMVKSAAEYLLEKNTIAGQLGFFEQITGIALSIFKESKTEVSILETGIGGRLDSATASDADIIAYTPIGLDHQDLLGNSLTEIATEKAAIIRPGVKILSVPQQPVVESVLKKACQKAGVELQIIKPSRNLKLGLLGEHQQINASLAIAVAKTLSDFGLTITEEHITQGLLTVRHPGRLEYLADILFDGAHNPAGAKALQKYLQKQISKPIAMMFGRMGIKDIEEFAEILFPLADKLILTRPIENRGLDPNEIENYLPKKFTGQVVVCDSPEQALAELRKYKHTHQMCVTGSLFLVGEVQKLLKSKKL